MALPLVGLAVRAAGPALIRAGGVALKSAGSALSKSSGVIGRMLGKQGAKGVGRKSLWEIIRNRDALKRMSRLADEDDGMLNSVAKGGKKDKKKGSGKEDIADALKKAPDAANDAASGDIIALGQKVSKVLVGVAKGLKNNGKDSGITKKAAIGAGVAATFAGIIAFNKKKDGADQSKESALSGPSLGLG